MRLFCAEVVTLRHMEIYGGGTFVGTMWTLDDIGLTAIPVDQTKLLLGRKLWHLPFLLLLWWLLCSDHLADKDRNGCGSRNSNR